MGSWDVYLKWFVSNIYCLLQASKIYILDTNKNM